LKAIYNTPSPWAASMHHKSWHCLTKVLFHNQSVGKNPNPVLMKKIMVALNNPYVLFHNQSVGKNPNPVLMKKIMVAFDKSLYCTAQHII
jgi:hypothetical protein